MTTTHKDSTEFLKQLDLFLEQVPESQDATLHDIKTTLRTIRGERDNDSLEKSFQALGTAVGKQKQWQTSFRETGILELALEDLDSDSATIPVRKQYLRVIGNSVADNDVNREIVTKSLQKLVLLLSNESLAAITQIVLFNLCNEYDSAKAATAALRLDVTIADKLFHKKIPEEALDYAVEVLSWTTEKLTAEQLKDTDSFKVFFNLLKVALQYDEDHYSEYVAIIVHYLQDPEFQQKVVIPDILDDLVILMFNYESHLTPSEIEAVYQELAITKTDDKPASEEITVILLSQLINSISALSATDGFAHTFTARSPVVEKIRTKLDYSIEQSPSAVCACVMLGNLAMSDEICIDMVKNMELHLQLKYILFFSKHTALLYAALGFLRHLAFPEANRTELGDARIIEACHDFLHQYPDGILFHDPAVRGEIAALLCKLVTNNPKNIERVVMYRVGERRGEPGELPLRSVTNGPTCLSTLVKQSLQPTAPLPSTAMKNIMVETGRTIVAVLRYLGRTGAEANIDAAAFRQRMFECENIARPVARLVRQRFYADARSEGLLGLGLMAQSPQGAARVIEELKEDSGLLEAIKEFAEGKDGGVEQQGQAAGRDYQNAMVLLQALQNQWGSGSDEALRDRVISLQDLLGKLMA
ncbi:armadillo-type protein [Phaeosphaeriaceae sp. PMI808]|nr:armadillo-type protein [Phaeosphaeriaceae sp. PMI808]